jgi:hypothetical protein
MKQRFSIRISAAACCGLATTPVSCLLLIGALPEYVYGYTDPGSGALALQMLAAAAVGVIFYFRRLLMLCTKVFRKAKSS